MSSSDTSGATVGPVALKIREKLAAAFQPFHLDVLNESYMHNVPKGSETHFKVSICSIHE
jgi:stress-induced morphogen